MTAAEKLAVQVVKDLEESWRLHGAAALKGLYEEDPQAFREIVELFLATPVTH